MNKTYYVYILASESGALHIGATTNLKRRIGHHKQGKGSMFTKRYRIRKLIYYEEFVDADEALAREKQIKTWPRSKKIDLFSESNPRWLDLAAAWFDSDGSL